MSLLDDLVKRARETNDQRRKESERRRLDREVGREHQQLEDRQKKLSDYLLRNPFASKQEAELYTEVCDQLTERDRRKALSSSISIDSIDGDDFEAIASWIERVRNA